MSRILASVFGFALLLAADSALAERVYVKARGEVQLAPFKCETVARSANVKRICYDEPNEYLLVSLNGIWYHFCGVKPATVRAWKQSSSKGRYYNDSVRDNFDCTVVPPPSYK